MNHRVSGIIDEITHQLDERRIPWLLDNLYSKINSIQKEILRELQPKKEFKIVLEKGKTEYQIYDENSIDIFNYFNSWSGTFKLVPFTSWEDYRTVTGSNPIYGTIFADKLIVAPAPGSGTITIWANQIYPNSIIDEDIPPEIPIAMDDVLIQGVVSRYDPEEKDDYLAKMDKYSKQHKRLDINNYSKDCNW